MTGQKNPIGAVRPAIPHNGCSAHHADFRVRLQNGDMLGKFGWQPDIIGIKERDILTAGMSNAGDLRVALMPRLRCSSCYADSEFFADIWPRTL